MKKITLHLIVCISLLMLQVLVPSFAQKGHNCVTSTTSRNGEGVTSGVQNSLGKGTFSYGLQQIKTANAPVASGSAGISITCNYDVTGYITFNNMTFNPTSAWRHALDIRSVRLGINVKVVVRDIATNAVLYRSEGNFYEGGGSISPSVIIIGQGYFKIEVNTTMTPRSLYSTTNLSSGTGAPPLVEPLMTLHLTGGGVVNLEGQLSLIRDVNYCLNTTYDLYLPDKVDFGVLSGKSGEVVKRDFVLGFQRRDSRCSDAIKPILTLTTPNTYSSTEAKVGNGYALSIQSSGGKTLAFGTRYYTTNDIPKGFTGRVNNNYTAVMTRKEGEPLKGGVSSTPIYFQVEYP